MTRRQLAAGQAFTLLRRESQNTHVKLRTIAQTVIQTGDIRTAPGSASSRVMMHHR
jgi:AmiR/NasT family two-component response regulator